MEKPERTGLARIGKDRAAKGIVPAGKSLAGGLALALLLPGCIALPIPHTVVEHGAIRGRVVDDETGRPIAGVKLFLDDDAAPEAISDGDGHFEIAEHERWRLFWVVPLLPIHPDVRQFVHFNPPWPPPVDGRRLAWRDTSLRLQSTAVTSIVGDRGESNRGIVEELGTIRLKSFEVRR